MKKIIAFGLIFTSFIWMVGCTNQQEHESPEGTNEQQEALEGSEWIDFQYNVQAIDASDSVEGLNSSKAFAPWHAAAQTLSSMKNKRIETDIPPVPMDGIYQSSQTRRYEYFLTHTYAGEKGTITIDDQGHVVEFLRYKEDAWRNPGNGALSQEECLAAAEHFLPKMVENAEDFQLKYIHYFESYEEYEACFVKKIGSWNTAERVRIWITPVTGEITACQGLMIGKIDQTQKIDIDKEKLDEAVEKNLDGILSGANERYDEVNITSIAYTLTRNENRYIVICDAKIECVSIEGEQRFIETQLVQFAIT